MPDLGAADLTGADLADADLTGADLSYATSHQRHPLPGADVSQRGLH